MNEGDVVIADICGALEGSDRLEALSILAGKYPFEFKEKKARSHSDTQKVRLFLRDGFIDRYSGKKLVFPPVLRILSKLFPKEFPYHPHWKMAECHIAYWELAPTVDHVVPVTRGGEDEESNWVCTSQLRNSAKSNWLLEELGWELHPAGNADEWDGLLSWYVKYIARSETEKHDPYFWKWYEVARKEIET